MILGRTMLHLEVIGRYTGMNIGSEYAVNYGYDDYGRMNSVGSGSDMFSYGYLSNSGLVQTITRPGSLSTIFSYENNRDLITAVENKHGNDLVSGYAYLNDAIGRRSSMARSGSAFSTADTLAYGYNDRSEVTSAVSNNISNYNYGYSFDNIGNRLASTTSETSISSTYVSNNLNQYSSVNSASSAVNPSYDFDGNMLNNGIWTFTWNAENQLVKAEKADQKIEFVYDYMGRCVEKKIYSGSSSNWTLNSDLKFVYDDFKCIEVLNASNENAIMQKFVWQPEAIIGLDVPLYIADTVVNATYYYFTDVNKNIGQLMDASGSTIAKYEYSPFGKQVGCSGDYADANPFRFSSEYFDSETGLIYYNYRYYSPSWGMWLSRDYIEEKGGWNLYSFVLNSPLTRIDRLGLCWSSARAIWQYWTGVGRDVSLSETGCEPIATTITAPYRGTWKEIVAQRAAAAAAALSCPGKDKVRYERTSALSLEPEIYWIGGFELRQSAVCTLIKVCKEPKCYWAYSCGILNKMNDPFSAPLDVFNTQYWLLDHDLIGFPYYVKHDWVDSVSGGGE